MFSIVHCLVNRGSPGIHAYWAAWCASDVKRLIEIPLFTFKEKIE